MEELKNIAGACNRIKYHTGDHCPDWQDPENYKRFINSAVSKDKRDRFRRLLNMIEPVTV